MLRYLRSSQTQELSSGNRPVKQTGSRKKGGLAHLLTRDPERRCRPHRCLWSIPRRTTEETMKRSSSRRRALCRGPQPRGGRLTLRYQEKVILRRPSDTNHQPSPPGGGGGGGSALGFLPCHEKSAREESRHAAGVSSWRRRSGSDPESTCSRAGCCSVTGWFLPPGWLSGYIRGSENRTRDPTRPELIELQFVAFHVSRSNRLTVRLPRFEQGLFPHSPERAAISVHARRTSRRGQRKCFFLPTRVF